MVMRDLKNAIHTVLDSADLAAYDGDERHYIITGRALWELQQEYNIYFVEPDEPQLEVIEK